MNHKIAIVIPTIGRYAELRRMLASLAAQTRLPDQVLIVGEGQENESVAREFPRLAPQYICVANGSACKNRNVGAKAAGSGNTLIGFMDDDTVLEPGAIEAMLRFWETAPAEVGGAGFNLVNSPPLFAPRLKSLRLASLLGLYHVKKGAVLRSGIHTLIGDVRETACTEWLHGCAVYSRQVLQEFGFDEWFEGYSYLEDLDFSYRVGKKSKLVVVAEARIQHHPSPIGRPNWFDFGRKEVVNRLYFVSKNNELSRTLCRLALAARAFMSTCLGVAKFEPSYFKRVAGNVAGIFHVFRFGIRIRSSTAPHPSKVTDSLKRITYRQGLLKIVRRLGLSTFLRRIYFRSARPQDGILRATVAGVPADFYVRTPGELRILDPTGDAQHELPILELFRSTLHKGDTFYDIGSNVGLYSVMAGKIVGDEGRVVAFEPMSEAFAHLSDNLHLNGLTNVLSIRKALGDSDSEAMLFLGEENGNSSLVRSNISPGGFETVEIVQGDSFIRENNLPVPVAVKIDVEGYEYAVLSGLKKTLSSPICSTVCCEVHPTLLPPHVKPPSIDALLTSVGFHCARSQLRKDTYHIIATKRQDWS